jgi:hypothetical protein
VASWPGSSSFVVRHGTPEDVPAATTAAAIHDDLYHRTPADNVVEKLKKADPGVLVVEDRTAKAPAGFFTVFNHFIDWLNVMPLYQRRGVMLCASAVVVDWMLETQLLVDVDKPNSASRGLFGRLFGAGRSDIRKAEWEGLDDIGALFSHGGT